MEELATRESWKIEPITDPKRIVLSLQLTTDQFSRIQSGLIPRDMGDKWFIYFENNIKSEAGLMKGWSNLGSLLTEPENVDHDIYSQLLREKIKSVLFGVAVGDAVGVPVEFKPRSMLKANPVIDMIGYGTYNLPPGTFSDDGSLTFWGKIPILPQQSQEDWPVCFMDLRLFRRNGFRRLPGTKKFWIWLNSLVQN